MSKAPICKVDEDVSRRRTYEIIGKYIARSSDIKLVLEKNATPVVDIASKTITLPSNITTPNIYPAIAWLIHEASHVRHTTFDSVPITGQDKIKHEILNFIEDIRIDRKAFHVLPNIRGFFEEMVKFVDAATKLKDTNGSIESRVLIDCLLMMEGFNKYTSKDPHIKKFIETSGIVNRIDTATDYLDQLEDRRNIKLHSKKVASIIQEIEDLLYMFKNNPQNQPPPSSQGQPGQPGGQPGGGGGAGQSPSPSPSPSPSQSPQPQPQQGNKQPLDLSGIGGGSTEAIFGKLDPNAAAPTESIPEAAIQEMTQKNFKEILNVKEKHVSYDGTILDTDNLMAFFTGDVEELFKEDSVILKKKSKIIMVLDCSGSMTDKLVDKEFKYVVVASMAKSIAKILDSCQHEGLETDYEVRAFDTQYHILDKSKFVDQYARKVNGGTDIAQAFEAAQEELIKDTTIEGKRIIILITDGDVSNMQIDEIRQSILNHNQDVRCMIIGVGCDPNGSFVNTVSGYNIIANDMSDTILLEAIAEMMQ